MLRSLHIQNYVLIRQLDIHFSPGFSVITGETGAGKSILMGALNLLIGGRADTKAIFQGQKKCVVEAVFDLQNCQLRTFFEENDLDYSEECTFRREVLINGKSRMFINDTPVSINLLKSISDRLIDIHSQHNNLLLKENAFSLEVLDSLAGQEESLRTYQQCFRHWQQEQKTLHSMEADSQQAKEEWDYLQFQLHQLQEAHLQAGEQEQLEQELQGLEHASELQEGLGQSDQLLQGEQNGVLNQLKQAEQVLQGISPYHPQIAELTERIQCSRIELKDINSELDHLLQHIEVNPLRLQEVQQRLDTLYNLQQKHRVHTVAELLDLQTNLEKRLKTVENSDQRLHVLSEQVAQQYQQLRHQAQVLSQQRKQVSVSLEQAVVDQLQALGIPHARFRVDIQTQESIDLWGSDRVTFLFSANKQQSLQAAGEFASGGEISRLMLCIKSQVAKSKSLPTLIFDEIDTGISGEIAAKMGKIMQQMGTSTQLLCITHLPQVAALGSTHYKVYKQDGTDATTTQMDCLDSQARIREIATMLSGENLTETALQHARILLGEQA